MAIKFLNTVQVDTDVLYVDTANDRVGIRTNNPNAALQIGNPTGSVDNQIHVLSDLGSASSTSSSLILATSVTGIATLGMGRTQFANENTAGKIIYSSTVDTFSFETNFSTKMVIDSSGNVGIGATSPGQKLEVGGNILATGTLEGNTSLTIQAPSPSSYGNFRAIAGTGGTLISANPASSNTSTISLGFGINDVEKMRIDHLGNVGIGTTNPGAKLDVDGNIIVSGGVSNENDGARVTSPGGASFITQTSSVAGAIKITLPQAGINTMMRMEVKVYEYLTNESFTVQCGGYSAGTSQWYNEYAYIESSAKDDRNFTVRFGYDGSKSCIYIGELTSAWSYPQVFVTEFQGGYLNTTGYKDSWDISFEASAFQGVVKTQADTQINNWARSGADTYYASSTGNVGIGTTSPQSQIGSTKILDISSNGNGEVILDHTDAGATSDIGLYSWNRNNDHLAHIKASCDGAIDAAFISFHAQATGGSFANASSNEKMRIESSGDVGIGTTSPSEKLEIVGNIKVSGDQYFNGSVIEGDGKEIIRYSDSWLRINEDQDFTSGIYCGGGVLRTDGTLQVGSSGSRFIVNSSGDVGINDTSPSYKLDVAGEGRFTGDLRCLSLIQTSQSDKKESISGIIKTTNKKIEFKEYVYKSDSGNRKRYGVLAEDIEVDYPELVHMDADGVKGVNYIDLLVKRVSELEKEIEDIAPRSMFLNWRGYHSSTNNGVLFDSGWSTNLTYPYATIIAPFKGSVSKISVTNNPYSSYQSGPTGNGATLQVVINGNVEDTVTVSYSSPSAEEMITFNFSGNHEFSENDRVQLRFQSSGYWRYINTGIQLKETI